MDSTRYIDGTVLIDLEPRLLNNYLENNGENEIIQTAHFGNYTTPVITRPWRQCLKKAILYENNWGYSKEIDPVSCQLQDLFGYVYPKNSKNKKFCDLLSRKSVFLTSSLEGLKKRPKFSEKDGFSLSKISDSKYTTAFAGSFLIDCDRIGKYTNNLGCYDELNEHYIEKCLKEGLIEDVSIENRDGKIYRSTSTEKQRIDKTSAILKAIVNTKYGSDQNSSNIDLSPKLIIFAETNLASLILSERNFDQKGEKVSILIDVLEEIIRDYSDCIRGNIYIGVENEFLENESELISFSKEFNGKLTIIDSPKKAVELFIKKELLEN